MASVKVNGKTYQVPLDDDDMPLLWFLRDHLGLMGTKYGCGIGECGACTVHADGEAVLACVVSVKDVSDRHVVTIEGLDGRIADALREAWIEEDVSQCGYCQPGQIMTAAALLAKNAKPDGEDIDSAMAGVTCRCGTYPRIRKAIDRAARKVSS
jgi:isoquinoline 1-oxidoreductase subunit alpha